jgi:hypothetical protein
MLAELQREGAALTPIEWSSAIARFRLKTIDLERFLECAPWRGV